MYPEDPILHFSLSQERRNALLHEADERRLARTAAEPGGSPRGWSRLRALLAHLRPDRHPRPRPVEIASGHRSRDAA